MAGATEVISHWHYSLEEFNTSTLEFYNAVEASLYAKQSPIKPERTEYRESGVLSDKREYLRVSYGRYSFDISAFPFGKDFTFSWWLVRRLPESSLMAGCAGIVAIPFLYLLFAKIFGVVLGFVALLLLIGVALALSLNASTDLGIMIEDAIMSLPVLGWLYRRYIRPITYYSEDSRVAFEEAIHRIVLAHVGSLLSVSKLPSISAEGAKVHHRRPFV
jgi:hypothetical protein